MCLNVICNYIVNINTNGISRLMIMNLDDYGFLYIMYKEISFIYFSFLFYFSFKIKRQKNGH